jgi:hypothetical protein
MEFNERFVEGRPYANLETAFNLLLTDEYLTFEECTAFFYACWTRRAYTERKRNSDAQKEAERAAIAEQEQQDTEQQKYLDSLRQQVRDDEH